MWPEFENPETARKANFLIGSRSFLFLQAKFLSHRTENFIIRVLAAHVMWGLFKSKAGIYICKLN
jgi:hypothetical protein